MQIQVNTGNGLDNSESLERWASAHLQDALARFGQDVTRVEVQLSDENSVHKGTSKGAADIRCTMEARLAHHQPLAVTHHADNQDLAFRGAAQKLQSLLAHTLGKLDHHKDRDTIRKDMPG